MIDPEYIPQVLDGIKESFKSSSPADDAKNLGRQLGSQLKNQILPYINETIYPAGNDSLDADIFLSAFLAAVNEEETLMDATVANAYFRTESEKVRSANMEAAYADNKEAGLAFLEANKSVEGVQVTESGLQYKVVKMGKGKKPSATDRVKVHYHGTLIDGKVFDSSVERGEPALFALNQVIPGWTEGLQLMPVGSKFTFYIPSELAYGDRETGEIKPFSALIFEVELLGIE
ncbi:MAG: FKBP-type peptidyl-prolyl cis-trans isomerase [Paludibacteraceae bacterium]|nr:FKBP-type peptidyl-prolyl cis-trans isomerase [Paludibacteraceae bacterium]